jgi:peptidoglycan hydrolase CwlO-like protein
MPRVRRTASLLLLVAAGSGVLAASGAADLTSRYQAGQQRSSQLQSKINDETNRIQGFEGTIGSLQKRLDAVQASVSEQEALLGQVSDQLSSARSRLAALQAKFISDRQALGTQLRAAYEAPAPTLVGVVVSSGGFGALLNGLKNLSAIERSNARTIASVLAAQRAVKAQAAHLAQVQARRKRATAAVLVERDNVAQIKVSIVNRELAVQRARRRNSTQLKGLRKTLVHEAQVLDAQAARAQTLSSGGAVAPPTGCANSPFVAHGGEYGFFQAPGTNYSMGEEPIIAARLDQLGRALQLHLEGISGYRTPQHSVEVGGFADDPHTHGLASDTPGVEGVPESTLEEFCLTRPFPGAREADHMQES